MNTDSPTTVTYAGSGGIVWTIVRLLILLVLLACIAGVGLCGWIFYAFDTQAGGRTDPLSMLLLAVLAVIGLAFAWVFWVVLRTFFRPAAGGAKPGGSGDGEETTTRW